MLTLNRALIGFVLVLLTAACDVPPGQIEQPELPALPQVSPGGHVLPALGDLSDVDIVAAQAIILKGPFPRPVNPDGPVISNDPEWCTDYYRSCMAVCHFSLCNVIPSGWNCWICEQGCIADFDRCAGR